MVTRTITATKVNALCLNITTAEPFNKDIVLSGSYKDAKSLEKAVKTVIDTEEVKAVSIVSKEETETLYGMAEQKFIENAIVLPARGTKEVKDESAVN